MTRRIRRKPHKIKTKTSILKTKSFWYTISAAVLLLAIFYFVVFFNKVQIKNIYVTGNIKTPTNQIESLILQKINKKILFLSSKSIFLADTSGIKNIILENFPVVDDVNVKRKFFSTLNITVKEREPRAIFCRSNPSTGSGQEEKCFFIDDTGVASESIDKIASGFVVVRLYDNKEVVLGKQVMSKETMGYILKAEKSLNDKYSVIVDLAEIASEIRLNIKTNEGWEVYFNLSEDMDLQISKLILLLEKEIPKESRGQLKYIDLRFERAYICDKNSPCSK